MLFKVCNINVVTRGFLLTPYGLVFNGCLFSWNQSRTVNVISESGFLGLGLCTARSTENDPEMKIPVNIRVWSLCHQMELVLKWVVKCQQHSTRRGNDNRYDNHGYIINHVIGMNLVQEILKAYHRVHYLQVIPGKLNSRFTASSHLYPLNTKPSIWSLTLWKMSSKNKILLWVNFMF